MELELSLATEADIPAVAEFCNQHRGRWLPVPDDAEFRQAISDGYLFMAAEAGRRAGPDTVHAVAGTFTCGERAGRGGRRILVHELASMVVDGELGGLHPIPMQQLMLTLRIVALALALAEDTCLLVSVAGGNVRSIDNVVAVGATAFDAPGWLQAERSSWCPAGEIGAVKDFIITPECFKPGVTRLKRFLSDPVLYRMDRQSGNKDERRFSTAIPWLTEQVLSRLELGDDPDWDRLCPD